MKIYKISNSSLVEELMSKYKAMGVKLYIAEGEDYLTLMEIIVPKGQRKNGTGTTIMNELVQIADQLGKRILLTPDTSYGGSSVNRLKDFYKRFDFLDNKGRNKDYSISDQMYREPQINEKTLDDV